MIVRRNILAGQLCLLTALAICALSMPGCSSRAGDTKNSKADDRLRRQLSNASGKVDPVEERPEWLNERAGDYGTAYRVVVHTGLTTTSAELKQKLEQQLTAAGEEFVREKYGEAAVIRLTLTPEFLMRQKVADFKELQERTVGTGTAPVQVTEQWVRLEFTPDVQREIDLRWHKLLVEGRLETTAVWCAGVLGCLAVVYGLLKFTIAREARRANLPSAAAAIIMVVLGAAIITAT